MPHLTELLASCQSLVASDYDLSTITINHLAYDSRQVTPQSVFVAMDGAAARGADYIEDAIARGAQALVIGEDVALTARATSVPVIRTKNARLVLTHMAAALYPGQPACVAAVTGTDGKTSTAHFLRQLWEHLGLKAASIGTLGYIGQGGALLYEGTHTTPDPIILHQRLAELAAAGYTHVALEASSHGLDQHRLDCVHVSAAAYTNLSAEHLDYHHDMQHYFEAKARLFSELLAPSGAAVINVEDGYAAALAQKVRRHGAKVVEYGEDAVDLRITEITPAIDGQHISLVMHGKNQRLHIPLVGNFQIYNMLAAMGLAMAGGYAADDMLPLLPRLEAVPGRLQRVAMHACGAAIYIDYAHTPAALEKALGAIRPHTAGRLLVVFGAGGNRDASKRPKMGAVAAGLADVAMITDDNPRHEDPLAIRQQIAAACPGAHIIGDRRQAISEAMAMLQPGDSLLVAGKGHETTQTIGDTKSPFNDADVILEVLG